MFHDNDAHFINGITLNVRDLRTYNRSMKNY